MKQASDDHCLGSVLTATNRVEERPFLHQQPSSCSSGMKQLFESVTAGARTGPGAKISSMLGNKVGRRRVVRRHERTVPSSAHAFDNPQSQLRIRRPRISRSEGTRCHSKYFETGRRGDNGHSPRMVLERTTERASWAMGRREEGEMIVRTTQVDATVCVRIWDRTAQKVGMSDGLPKNSRRVRENKTRQAKSLGEGLQHEQGGRAHHRF